MSIWVISRDLAAETSRDKENSGRQETFEEDKDVLGTLPVGRSRDWEGAASGLHRQLGKIELGESRFCKVWKD